MRHVLPDAYGLLAWTVAIFVAVETEPCRWRVELCGSRVANGRIPALSQVHRGHVALLIVSLFPRLSTGLSPRPESVRLVLLRAPMLRLSILKWRHGLWLREQLRVIVVLT